MTSPAIFPSGQITPLGDARTQLGTVPEISFVGVDGSIFYLQGGKAPDLSCEDGFGLLQISGMQAPLVLLDEQGARQDGITNLDTVFDPCILKMTLEASGVTPASFRRTWRTWLSSWNPPAVGTLSVFTKELGLWWMSVRQNKAVADPIETDPSLHRKFRFTWEARGDNAFWQGPDSVSAFRESSGTGFCPLTNLGTRPAWPRYLITGPGTFTIGNGAHPIAQGTISNAGKPVTFGPLLAGQRVAIYTEPRLRSVVDLSASQPAQSLTAFQKMIKTLIDSSVGASSVPPQLQSTESVFGILPPQGPMYSLLTGRFTSLSMLPPKLDGYMPVTSYIPVSITGGDGNSQIVAAATPYRTWPW